MVLVLPQKINGKFPINSCFAGKTMTMKDVNQNILKNTQDYHQNI